MSLEESVQDNNIVQESSQENDTSQSALPTSEEQKTNSTGEKEEEITSENKNNDPSRAKKKNKFGKKKHSTHRNRKTVSNYKTEIPENKEQLAAKKEDSPSKDDPDQVEYSITAKYHYDNLSFESAKENEEGTTWDNYGNKLIQKFDKTTPASSKHTVFIE